MSNYRITAGTTGNVPIAGKTGTGSNVAWSIYHLQTFVASASVPQGFNVTPVTPPGLSNITSVNVTVPAGYPVTNNMTAILGNANSSGDNPISAQFDIAPAPPPAPAAPTGLTATSGQNNAVPLAWTAPSGSVTGYPVYRGTGGAKTRIATASASPYTDYTAVNGTTYYYQVSALNGASEGPLSGEAAATPAAPAGALPSGVNLWAAGPSPAAAAFAAAPLLIDGAADDGTTGYDGA